VGGPELILADQKKKKWIVVFFMYKIKLAFNIILFFYNSIFFMYKIKLAFNIIKVCSINYNF